RRETLADDRADTIGRNAFLLQGGPVPQRHRAVLPRLSVNREAIRRADFILPAIATSDGPRLVVEHREARPKLVRQLLRELRHAVFFHERKDARLDRRQRRMQSEHDATLGLAFDGLLAICVY